MPSLNIPLEDTPDDIPPIPAGEWTLEIFETPVIEDNKNTEGQHLTVPMRIYDEDSEFHGRQLRDFIGLGNQMGNVRVKQLCKAAGVQYSNEGVNLEDFFGKVLKANLVQKKEKDGDRVFTNVGSYVFDRD